MFESNPSKENNRWREKYLAKAEAFEKQKTSSEDYIHLLQRVLVRVSLVADGKDPTLDKELNNLRRLLRKDKPSKLSLTASLSSLESMVRNLDHQHEEEGSQGMLALERLVDQLSSLSLTRANKRALEKIAKQLNTKNSATQEYPALLAEYAQIQKNIIDEKLTTEDSKQQNSGLLSKLFSGRSETEQTTTEETPSITDQPATETAKATTGLSDETSSLVQTEDKQDSSQNLQEPEKQEEVPETDSIKKEASAESEVRQPAASSEEDVISSNLNATEISAALTLLIENLIVPDEEREEAERILEEINRDLSPTEYSQTVNDLAALVIQLVNHLQQDFEEFLRKLDQQLVEINNFIDGGTSAEEDWRNASTQFDQNVRGQMGSISKEISTATEISPLKEAVQMHLDSITQSMDELVEAEKLRQEATDEQVAMLEQQLHQMENETNAIKKRLQAERIKAMTDVLTQLPNREALDERLNTEWERFQRYQNPTCLVVADIDHFKDVNDQHGHLVGDKVLQAISGELATSIRKTDFLARFGGEEFVILLPETDQDTAVITMNKLRQSIEDKPLKALMGLSGVTLSFGIAAFRKGIKAEELLSQADKALYLAKEKGRNRVETYG